MERIAALLAFALLGPAPAAAQDIAAAPTAAPITDVVDDLAIGEADLRMTVPVSIAGKGDWPFVIDTGSERTVLSHELARRLALAPGPTVRVTTMTGSVAAPTAMVPLLRMKSVRADTIEAPTFARANLGAIGMLGIDALQGHSVAIDFAKERMALKPSKKRRAVAGRGEVVIVAKSLYGQLIVTDAQWRGRKISVVVDTGSPVTIGNPAFLALAKKPPPLLGPMTVIAPSGDQLPADVYLLDRLSIGGVTFKNAPVAIADVAPFHRFGLGDKPALLLGMETLRMFRAVEIDFANRSIRLTLPRAAFSAGPQLAGL